MSAYDLCHFFVWATILKYKQLKMNFTFLIKFIMKSKKSKVLLYGQAVFSLSRFHSLHFLLYVIISYIQQHMLQNKTGPWRLSGSGKKLSCVCFITFFDLSIHIGLVILNYNQFIAVLLSLFLFSSGVFPFIGELFWFMGNFSFYCYTYCIKCNNGQKELTYRYHKLSYSQKYFSKRNIW